jgi:hypothetical protein
MKEKKSMRLELLKYLREKKEQDSTHQNVDRVMTRFEAAKKRREENIQARIESIRLQNEHQTKLAMMATAQEEQSKFFKLQNMKMRLERARKNRQDFLIDRIEKAVQCAEPKVRYYSAKILQKTVIVHCEDGHYEQMLF